MKERWRIVVSGLVQGVFYRKSVEQFVHSNRPKLVGFVRNIAGGEVELEVVGLSEDLDALREFCERGPANSRVDNLVVEKLREQDGLQFECFEISY